MNSTEVTGDEGAGKDPSIPWWGVYELEENTSLIVRVNSTDLIFSRLNDEWRFKQEERESETRVAVRRETGVLVGLEEGERYCFRHSPPSLSLLPACADRPVVTRPRSPLWLVPGESVTLYVSSPSWFEMAFSGKVVKSAPLMRPSDTWFGNSTREGTLCYASRTHAYRHLDSVPLRPHRILTEIEVVNRSQEARLIERIALPVENLSVFTGEEAVLVTEPITLAIESTADNVNLAIGRGAPPFLASPRLLHGARQPVGQQRTLIRALSSLLG